VKPFVMLFMLVISVVAALAIAWLAAPAGAWWYHRQSRFAEEIAWLESLQPLLPLGASLDGTLDRLHRGQVERELRAGRVDRAVQAMRLARRRLRREGAPRDERLIELGLETYTRAADRVRAHGRLSLAADWLDTLFVFAVGDRSEKIRSQASASFLEALELRVQDRQPCAALARWRWAERGLRGAIPDVSPVVGQELERRCAQAGGAR